MNKPNKIRKKAVKNINKTPRSKWSSKDCIKKLGEEVHELTWAVARKDTNNIREEVGDAALLLIMILERSGMKGVNLQDLALETAKKVKERKTIIKKEETKNGI